MGGGALARIHELLRQLRANGPANAALADDMEREVDALSNRRAFGLNFERHTPEEVELPGRPVRTGDKVHILSPRGTLTTAANLKLWRVTAIDGKDTDRIASLETYPAHDQVETTSAELGDLVVVAEFRDPIYPGLVSTEKVERGGEKPYHAVVNAENFHALQTLLFSHRGKVDAIYIDPPYNTGARDWKYSNDYVESDDLYRHSKWLAFIERRLLLAKDLLNPNESVLIVTIDEKEYMRLGLLLEQVFPEASIQMVSSVINPKGATRSNAFGRTDEYLYFVTFGRGGPKAQRLGTEWKVVSDSRAQKLRWADLLRAGTNAQRSDRPNQFYPVFVSNSPNGPVFRSVGHPYFGSDHKSVDPPDGCVAVWPLRSDGTEGNWQVGAEALRQLIAAGYARAGSWRQDRTTLSYLKRGEQAKVESGIFPVVGNRADGSIIVDDSNYVMTFVPGTQWRISSHEAGGSGGSGLLRTLIPERRFPFPKSVYAVEDALRFFVMDKPEAVVLDFFSGSGTTTHAVMRLNKQDNGRRVSIAVTNNEVGADEHVRLRKEGFRPGDPEWEQWGICDYITKPRIRAAVTGQNPGGQPITGSYKFNDIFPMADGFDENVEFFTMTYEAPLRLRANRDFKKIAPLLWLRAGSRGRRIDSIPDGWAVADTYGVLANLDQTDAFVEALSSTPSATVAFIITDDDSLFEAVTRDLPLGVEPIRMYDAYLRNFEIDAMRGVR